MMRQGKGYLWYSQRRIAIDIILQKLSFISSRSGLLSRNLNGDLSVIVGPIHEDVHLDMDQPPNSGRHAWFDFVILVADLDHWFLSGGFRLLPGDSY